MKRDSLLESDSPRFITAVAHSTANIPTDDAEWRLAESPVDTPVLKMKYIRHKKLGFILFEGSLRHDEVAETVGGRDQVVSAGFVFAPVLSLKCLGYSESLQLHAAESDGNDLRSRMSG